MSETKKPSSGRRRVPLFALPSPYVPFGLQRIYDDPHVINAVIVRHPIARLLSGYLDKIVARSEYWRIEDLPAYVAEYGVPSFPQFVDFLFEKYPDPYNVDDIHFNIQSNHCGLQHHSMDFVGHLDDLGPDFEEFAKSVDIWDDYVSTGWGKDGSQAFGAKSYEEVQHHSEDHLWEQYTTELANKVFQYYRDDFLRFGFSLQSIMDREPDSHP